MNIIAAAGQKVICDSVRMIVCADRTHVFCGQADSVAETMRLVRGVSGPLMVIAGAHLPDGYAADLMRSVSAENAAARFIILTRPNEIGYAREALKLGACALCLIDDIHDMLPRLLGAQDSGVVSLPARMMQKLLSDDAERLTRREHEILVLLAEGLTNFQISARLGLSPNTVKYYLKAIYQKLDVTSRGAAIAKFVAGDF